MIHLILINPQFLLSPPAYVWSCLDAQKSNNVYDCKVENWDKQVS